MTARDLQGQALRLSIRDLLSRLESTTRQRSARDLARRLLNSPLYQQAHRIAAYLAVRHEIDLSLVIEQAWRDGKAVYLPIVTGQILNFGQYRIDTQLDDNRFHIPEPVLPRDEWLEPSDMELVLTPLTAFDNRGHRLGSGGGFYDRSFAVSPGVMLEGPLLLGVAYALQEVAQLERQSWDLNLAGVCTESSYRQF